MKKLAFIVAALAACAHAPANSTSAQAAQAAAAPAVKAAPVPQPLLSWYRLPDSEYSVLMPPSPKTGEQDRNISAGQVKVHFAQAMPPGGAGNYFVSVAQFPQGVLEKANPASVMDNVQQSTLKEMGAQLVSAKDINEQGLPGREFSAKKGNEGNILGRVLVGDQRIFTLIGTYDSPQPPDRLLKFLDSFSKGNGAQQGASASLK